MSEWFNVKVGVYQGYVNLRWLLNLYIDEVVREVLASKLEKRGTDGGRR